MQLTDVYTTDEVRASIARVAGELSNLRRIGTFALSGHGNDVVIQTRLQAIFKHRPSDELDRKMHELILSHGINAEKAGPGGFDLCISFILEGLERLYRGEPVNDRLSLLRPALSAGVMPPTLQDVESVISFYGRLASPKTMYMLREALALAGFGGRVLVEKSSASTASLELVRGYTFDVDVAIAVTARLDFPRVVVIDGFIESVSEIHHLLEAASESKEPVLLFTRGASDDVLNTLKVNFDRGSLRVIPLTVKFDLNGINTLKDIAIVAGTDVVSSLKGELMSSIKYDACPRIQRAVVYPKKTILSSVNTRDVVKLHVVDLQRRQKEQTMIEGSKLYDDRIRSLSPNHVVIRLVDDKDFIVSSQTIDYVLRALKALTDRGTIPGFDTPIGMPPLTSTIVGATIHADRCLRLIDDLGAAILS